MPTSSPSSLHRQAVRYLLAGAGVVALDFLTFVLLTHFWPAAYVAANIVSKSVGAGSGFFLHKHYTFAGQQDKSTPAQLGLYLCLYLGNTALSTAIIYLGVALLGGDKLLVKVVADALVIASSFVLNRVLVFRHRPAAARQEK